MKKKVKLEFSAGGVVVNNLNEVLLIKVQKKDNEIVWTFPKGHIETKESSESASIREVEEETGFKCEIIKLLDKVQYWFKENDILIKKTVTWFLMRPLEKTKEHNSEVLDVHWFNLKEAKNILNYKSDKQLIEKLS